MLPDVTGLDKQFDYLVPDAAARSTSTSARSCACRCTGGACAAGSRRSTRPSEVDPSRLQPVAQFSSIGPAAELIDLAAWASVRWAAGRLRPFLVAASPPTNVTALPPPAHGRAEVPTSAVGRRAAEVLAGGGGVLLLPPAISPVDAIVAAALDGPALVVMPTVGRAEAMAAALSGAGCGVAVVPRQWALAAAGVDVVIGARGAAWAPCPELGVAVVDRRARRDAAGGAQPDVARPRRGRSSGPAGPGHRCC